MSLKTGNIDLPDRASQGSSHNINSLAGIYIGTVVYNRDSIYTGRVKVRIPEFAINDDNDEHKGRWVSLCTPYGGFTTPEEVTHDPKEYGIEGASYNGTQKSYGMWVQPPAVGDAVVVAYSSGFDQGVLLGTIMFKDRNHMLGGRASAENYGSEEIAPVGEKNIYDKNDKVTKPENKEAMDILRKQGLEKDMLRGHSMSSARRESPSQVFGITTLNGHVFTMDDGIPEEAFGPVPPGDTRANVSQNIRIKTRGGAQILMDDTNKMIFVNNHDGSSWVEIDEHGNIDVYAKGKISMHSEDDFNVHTKGDFNVQADKDINIRSRGTDGIRMSTDVGNIEVSSGQHLNLYASLTSNILSSHHVETANRIDMNGPVAKKAAEPVINELHPNKNIIQSVTTRVPEHEPWEGHSAKQTVFVKAEGKSH